MAKFTVNNMTHLANKLSLFITNYNRELKIRTNIRRKSKVEKAIEFAERMKKVQEKTKAELRKTQKEMKWQTDRRRKVKE